MKADDVVNFNFNAKIKNIYMNIIDFSVQKDELYK